MMVGNKNFQSSKHMSSNQDPKGRTKLEKKVFQNNAAAKFAKKRKYSSIIMRSLQRITSRRFFFLTTLSHYYVHQFNYHQHFVSIHVKNTNNKTQVHS